MKKFQKLLTANDSQPFLFIGSGFSRRYLDTLDWKGLIKYFAEKAIPNSDGFAFQQYNNKVPKGTPENEILPIITSMVEKDFNSVFLTSKKYKTLREANKEAIQERNESPFKIAVSDYFNSQKEKFKKPNHSEEISSLGHCKRSISGVITTNYDQFIENIFTELNVYIGQNDLLFNQNFEISELYKIHGCSSKAYSMLLTEEDYTEFKEKSAYLSAKLLTIFLEHPIIFIGYSLNDPNINQILENITKCLNQTQIKQLSNRLFFIQRLNGERTEGTATILRSFGDKQLSLTQVTTDDYSAVYKVIAQSKVKYSPKVLRQLKKEIYELISTNSTSEKLYVLDIDDETNLDEVEVVMGVGISGKLGQQGYQGIEVCHLLEDVLLDNKRYDCSEIVLNTIPSLGRRCSFNLPIFKYISKYSGDIVDQKTKAYLNEVETKGKGKWISKSLKKIKPSIQAIEDINDTYDLKDPKNLANILMELALIINESTNPDTLKKFLLDVIKIHPNTFNEKISTEFRRIVKIYDWLKFGQKKTPIVLED